MGVFDQQGYPQQQRPGGGIGIRLIMALGIALVALFMYMSQVQENPVTGERQHVSLSPAQEIRLGLESAPEMSREMGGELPESDPRHKEVLRVGAMLLNTPEAQKSPWQFKFHLLADTETINAFALPGGQIFITLALYNKLQNEAQLAGVLGHEMGHVIERHSAQQMATSQFGQMLVVAVATGASDQNNSMGNTPAMIAGVVNQMFQLKYSRVDESQADIWGIKLMEKRGFNPEQMITVMQILKEASDGHGSTPEFFQTHPNPDLRMQQIKEYLAANPPPAGLTNGAPLVKVSDEGNNLFDRLRF